MPAYGEDEEGDVQCLNERWFVQTRSKTPLLCVCILACCTLAKRTPGFGRVEGGNCLHSGWSGALLWVCAENGVGSTGLFGLLLSSAHTELGPFLLLTPLHILQRACASTDMQS